MTKPRFLDCDCGSRYSVRSYPLGKASMLVGCCHGCKSTKVSFEGNPVAIIGASVVIADLAMNGAAQTAARAGFPDPSLLSFEEAMMLANVAS